MHTNVEKIISMAQVYSMQLCWKKKNEIHF